MEEIDANIIIKKNYAFFIEELLPYYIIINTYQGSIIINVEEGNLKHLLGINKTFNSKYKNMAATKFFDFMNDNNVDLFEIIDKQRYEDNELITEEMHIYKKNYFFIDVFESLFNESNIRLYLKKPSDSFDADYVQFTYINRSGGYIGIIGSEENNYHYFNSVIIENEVPEKYKGPSVTVKNIIRIKKNDFKFNEYTLVESKRFIKKKAQNITIKKKRKPTDLTALKKRKKELLKANLRISVGEFGNNTIQVYQNDKLVEKKLKIPEKYIYDKIEIIAEYINNKYGN